MIEMWKVNLPPDIEIQFINCDCALDFPGYSLEAVQLARDVFHLVRK
jgi:hypothetical protein